MATSLLDLLQRPSLTDKVASLMLPGNSGGGLESLLPPSQAINTASGDWEQIAQQMATQRGYSPQDWKMLDYIIEHESNWNPNAVNQGSGAYGIPQILPKAHPDVNLQNDPMGQLEWLFRYIDQRYGGIQGAYQHKQNTGWY